ncbi:hypothetical protein L914_17799 [Phytophthora nicotianae]|uniref:ABC transporter domain-containing protein n=1 Tax=Phytophthora nicotianae TaxID=4792 RepID=W2MG11_PHYNI|nr:hypothetical protein L914_17799 [Phytophthora nicotianae]
MSSLVVGLLRLVELDAGAIVIDGVDTSTIRLHDLRSNIAFHPQDTALFSIHGQHHQDICVACVAAEGHRLAGHCCGRQIQQGIRDEFRDCTALTLPHRTNMVLDSDRIVATEEGSVVVLGLSTELRTLDGTFSIQHHRILITVQYVNKDTFRTE